MSRAEELEMILKSEGFDGILGYYIFTGYWCELSFTESKIKLYKKKPDKFSLSAGGHVDGYGSPCITVNINGTIPITFIVDTGAPYAFGFPMRFMQYIKPADYREILTVDKALNVFETQFEIPIRSISMLDDTFTDKYIITSESPSNYEGIIGIEYLQYYDLLFDITYYIAPKTNWLWKLYYIPRFPDLDKNTLELLDLRNSKPRIGLTQIFTEQGRFLINVWRPSIAYSEYGLMPGMTITHINGVLLNSLPENELSPLISKMADDDNCEITVIDPDGRQRMIKRMRQ
jgi:hypothetical protein